MEISTTTLGNATGTTAGARALDKDAFLNLLILQIRHQDPMNPLDNQEMVAQLAQFGTLEEMQNLNRAFMAELAATESVNNALATTLIGKEVKAVGDQIQYDGERPATVEFLLPAGGTAEVQVLDETGAVVRIETLTDLAGGWNEYAWDGRDNAGNELPAGTYQVKITQAGQDGAVATATTFVTGVVTGVRFDNGITYLLLGDRRVTLSEVLEINTASME